MKVGVLGLGSVAETLASGFLKHGHAVKVGSRSPEKLSEWAGKNPGGTAGTFAEAAAFGEVLMLAVKGSAAADVLRLAGAENLKGKTVMDACNPIADAPPVNGVLRFFTDLDRSLMEDLQTEDMGAVEAARAIEPLCMLWCISRFTKNDWAHAFKVVR